MNRYIGQTRMLDERQGRKSYIESRTNCRHCRIILYKRSSGDREINEHDLDLIYQCNNCNKGYYCENCSEIKCCENKDTFCVTHRETEILKKEKDVNVLIVIPNLK